MRVIKPATLLLYVIMLRVGRGSGISMGRVGSGRDGNTQFSVIEWAGLGPVQLSKYMSSAWNSLSHIEEATLHLSVYKRLRTRVGVCLRLQ